MRDETAAMVNAIQRHATVVVQKSIAEGFGPTVTEATWKARPIVASEEEESQTRSSTVSTACWFETSATSGVSARR